MSKETMTPDEEKKALEEVIENDCCGRSPFMTEEEVRRLATAILSALPRLGWVRTHDVCKIIDELQNPYPKKIFYSEEYSFYRKIYDNAKADFKEALSTADILTNQARRK